MPELPEVEIITRDLHRYAKDAVVEDVVFVNGYSVNPSNDYFLKHTLGHKITGSKRIAKNIVIDFSSGHFATIHLAMTGNLLLRGADHPSDNWPRLVLNLAKKGKKFALRFTDKRMFGKVRLWHKDELETFKSKYGPEPIDEKVTPQQFLNLIRSKNTNVKNVLLDQSKIAGLGNVYAIDALWTARIHPETKTKDIDINMAADLLEASREVLNEGIENRGISMSDYRDLFGKQGKQQEYFRVYKKEKCQRCGAKVVSKKINGRNTYFCPICQSLGNQKGLL